MNRASKKLKSDCGKSRSNHLASNTGSRIHSGHYMTSTLYDQSEDTVEMPIASPDATNNDVTLTTNLNAEQEQFVDTESEVTSQNKAPQRKNTASGVRKPLASGPMLKIQAMISSNGSVSGGITLDKNNKSLKNLMFYIRSAYSNNLTSPKWKNFKGLKLQVTEKIRLNNVIWRSWFEQYGKKGQPNMKLRLICQFANGLDEKVPMQKMSKKEEKYWKARLESITNEYKKWREISRKQIKQTCEIIENSIATNCSLQIGSSCANIQQPAASSLNEPTYFDSSINFQSNYQIQQNFVYQNNYGGINEFHNHNEFGGHNESNFGSYGPNTPQNINSFGNYNLTASYTQNNYTNAGSSVGGYSPSVPIASKQMQFNNRCRSPSPGLFDFDLNNFSSDTLFSTHLADDHKDTMFGTNPDLFQPDLMHLFPNFDFFDLSGTNNDVFNFNADTNSEQNSPQSSNQQMVSEAIQPVQIQAYSHQTSDSAVEADHVNKQSMSIAINYSDLSNFDTLATVAAAQSVTPGSKHSPQNNRPVRQRHMSDMGNFSHLKSSSDQNLSNNATDSIKMPTSLSQINSSLGINSMQYPVTNSVTNHNVRRSSGPQVQSNSSNTIRNLLALNTPTLPMASSVSPAKQTSNNIRISGILGVSGSTVPSIRKQTAPQKLIYQDTMSNILTCNPPNQNIVIVPSDPKTKTDNVSISSLLNSSMMSSQHNETSINQMMNQQDQFSEQVKPPPSKRGRKNADSNNSRSNSKTKASASNKTRVEDNSQSTQLNGLILSDSIESLSSPSPSSSQKFSNFNSFSAQNQIYQNTDSSYGDYSVKYKNGTFSKSPEFSFPSKINRSDSLNSVNTDNANLSTAEQKRRCNIQQGFDRLQILVPALKDGKNLKVSKAVMLQKTSEYIKELQLAREKRMSDLEVFKKEIDELSDKIAECQNQLPVSGVSVIGNLNKSEIFEQKFNAYVKEKSMVNWKYYLFSLILKPLFDNFIQTVNTSSKEDMERTFLSWQVNFCNLAQLRPIASNALRSLSRTTSVLIQPAKLPEECITAALSKI